MKKRAELLSLRVVILLVLLFTLLFIGSQVFGEADDMVVGVKYQVVRAEMLRDMMMNKDFILINVSFKCIGYIPGTDREIPFNLIDRFSDTIPPPENARIVLYCNRGYMSRVAARKLIAMGYSEVFVLEGGLEQWEISGNPVVGEIGR